MGSDPVTPYQNGITSRTGYHMEFTSMFQDFHEQDALTVAAFSVENSRTRKVEKQSQWTPGPLPVPQKSGPGRLPMRMSLLFCSHGRPRLFVCTSIWSLAEDLEVTWYMLGD